MRLDVDKLCFSYSGKPILKDISFSYEGPQLVAILGPNGVGKSTLINCIDRILKPTGGSVSVNGKDVSEYPMKELAKIIGYVPCFSLDTFPMTVADAVLLGRHPYSSRKTTRDDIRTVFDTLDMLGVLDLSKQQFNELSAGQHQKVLLARGLVQETEILLLDEPTANLDVKHQLGVTKLLRDLSRERKMLTVMICHDLNIAAKYADSVLMLKDGTVYASGPTAEVMTEENISAVYDIKCRVIEDESRPHVILRDGTV